MAIRVQQSIPAKPFIEEDLLGDLRFNPELRQGQDRARKSRQQIIDASLERIMIKGFEGFTTREIAQHAGVTQGLVTYHFKSKEGLWQAAMDRVFGDFRNDLADRITELNDIGDPLFYKLIIRHIVRWPSRFPFMIKFMSGTGSAEPEHLKWLVERHVRPIFQTVSLILEQGKAAGILKSVPTVHAYYLLLTASSIFSLDEEIRLLTGIDAHSPAFVEEQADMLISMLSDRSH